MGTSGAISLRDRPRRPSLAGVLGSSVPGARSRDRPAGNKGVRSSNATHAGDRVVVLARPVKAPFPNRGKTCGRRERGTERGTVDAERSSSARLRGSQTVEGIPVHGKTAPFAGRRRSVGLGRSGAWQRVSSPAGVRTGDSGCPEGAEDGNDVRIRSSKRLRSTREAVTRISRPSSDASIARSSDPCTSIATATSSVKSRRRWRVRVDIAVGQTCASGRNRHRGRSERTSRGSPRVTVPQGSRRDASEKEGRHGVRPCEDRESPGSVPACRSSCRNRQATSGLK